MTACTILFVRNAPRDNIKVIMKRQIVLLVLAIVFVCVTAGGAQRRPQNQPAPQADWMAQSAETESVVLQLDFDPNSGRQLESQTLVALLKSSALSDPAIEQALGMPALEARKLVVIDAQVTGYQFVNLSVAVKSNTPEVKAGSAKALVKQLCDRLSAAVADSSSASIAGFTARRESLEIDLTVARKRLEETRTALKRAQASNPRGANSGQNPRYSAQNLMQQRDQLELQLVGMKARYKELTASGPTTAPSAHSQPSDAWRALIELRQRRLDELKAATDKALISPAEIANAEIALAETRALAEALAPFARARVGSPYDNLESELRQLRASIAENEARLATINEQLARLPKVSDGGDDDGVASQQEVQQLQSDENRARNEVEQIQSQLGEMKRNNRNANPPRLTVLDGRNAAKN